MAPKWTRQIRSYPFAKVSGAICRETENDHKAADHNLAGKSSLRNALYRRRLTDFARAYAEAKGHTDETTLSAGELFDCLYAEAWCTAYGKPLTEYLSNFPSLKQASFPLEANP